MIKLIRGVDKNQYKPLIDAMYRNRADVFAERLGWDVHVEDGLEFDQFDQANPLYIVSVDPHTGKYRGSTRLLPTTGPNMLRDVFSCLLDDGDEIASATIWEGTRFSVDPDQDSVRSRKGVSVVTGELLCGAFEIGLMAGLSHIVAVYDARMSRVFDRADCQAELIGRPQRIGKVMTYAGFFEVSEETLMRVRAAAGVTESVLEPDLPAAISELRAA